MWWGGLRGAVSLALALAVTEQHNVPYEARKFIAVATTGFVLMTLFVNGVSLRKLIGRLGLNQLSPFERTLRNPAVVVALEDLREKTKEIAEYANIHRKRVEEGKSESVRVDRGGRSNIKKK